MNDRPRKPHEEAVDFAHIEEVLDAHQAAIEKVAVELVQAWAEGLSDLLDPLTPTRVGLIAFTPAMRQQIIDAILDQADQLYAFGRRSVGKELKAQATARLTGEKAIRLTEKVVKPVDVLVLFRATATLAVEAFEAQLIDRLRLILLDVLRARGIGITRPEVAAVVGEIMGALPGAAAGMAGRVTSAPHSLGRDRGAAKYADQVAKAIFSSLLDANTCGPCSAADGEEVELHSPRYREQTPPLRTCEGRTMCRCAWVFLLKPGATL